MPRQLHLSTSSLAVAQDFARYFAEQVADKDHFTVALSGGSTPKLLFKLWAEAYRDQINWQVVHFFWGDERCVPPTDSESNFGVTKALLLEHIDIPEENIHRVRGEDEPVAEAIRYAEEISDNTDNVDDLPSFDLVILGMGDDGHTASIFPHQMELLKANTTTVVATHPTSGQKRISFSGLLINNAQRVAFLVTGANKQEKVAAILRKQADATSYPAAHISPQSGDLHWFLDEAAWGATAG